MTIDFWCTACKKDLELPARVLNDYYFIAQCNGEDEDGDLCDKKLYRHIKNKHEDPYFRLSEKLRSERIRMSKDLIQPNDPRFKLYYKDEYDKIERAEQEYELKKKRDAEEKGRLLSENRHNINKRQQVEALLKIEERIDG